MKKKPKYQPINCNYYDEITLLILQKKSCEVHFYNEDKKEETIEALIIDVYTRDKAEYLKLANEREIRLDDVISLDHKKRPN